MRERSMHRRTCTRCGASYLGRRRWRHCPACARAHTALLSRARQQRRRAREKRERHIAAGLARGDGRYIYEEVGRCCDHCGAHFMPKRTTARYCSTRCRVAAHRARQSNANG
jgi:hypothetical protein